jgi:hypothetical protein
MSLDIILINFKDFIKSAILFDFSEEFLFQAHVFL